MYVSILFSTSGISFSDDYTYVYLYREISVECNVCSRETLMRAMSYLTDETHDILISVIITTFFLCEL